MLFKNRQQQATEVKEKKTRRRGEKKEENQDEDASLLNNAATRKGRRTKKTDEKAEEQKEEQEKKVLKEDVATTWGETKEIDDAQENLNQDKQPEPEEQKKEPVKKSWVPQQNSESQASQGFNDTEAYMPALGDPDAEKNKPVEEKPQQQASQPGAPGRPRFTNSKKNNDLSKGIDPSLLTPQQLKEMEMEQKLQKTAGGDKEIKFGGGPLKFTKSGGSKNNAPLELTEQQKKEMEAEEKLMAKRVYKQNFEEGQEKKQEEEAGEQKKIEFKSQPFKMSGGNKQKKQDQANELIRLQQEKEREQEEKLQKLKQEALAEKKEEKKVEPEQKSDAAERPRFGFKNTKKGETKTFQPLEKSEQQKKEEEIEKKLQEQKEQERKEREEKRNKKRNNNKKEEEEEKQKIQQQEEQVKSEGWNKAD